MRRQPNDRPWPDDLPGDRRRQVILADVQHVGAAGVGDVRAVVHGEQSAVPVTPGPEHFEQPQLLPGLQALLPELHDVHARPEHAVEESG